MYDKLNYKMMKDFKSLFNKYFQLIIRNHTKTQKLLKTF